MPGERFVYVTYIRTTCERLWQALTEPEFTRQSTGPRRGMSQSRNPVLRGA